MLHYSIDDITIADVCDIRKQHADGRFHVKIRVTQNRVRKYYATGKNLTMEEWEKLSDTKMSRQLKEVKGDIQISFDKVKAAVHELINTGKFSFEALNNRLGKGVTDTINTAFDVKIKQLEKEGAIGNMINYKCAIRSLSSFAGDKMSFESVTPEWLKKYEKHMLSEGKSYTTISMYLRCLRAIFNEAKNAGVVKEALYPFGKGKYEVPTSKGRKLALTLQQIKQVITYTDGMEATEHYRDLWFFSYLCNGINVNDMLKLKYSNIDGNDIHFYRSKTLHTSKEKKEIEALLTPEMKQIIERWGNPNKTPDNFVFPFLTGNETPMEQKMRIQDVTRRINKRLKMISDKLGIPGISTYTARHSFASVLKRSGANIAYISESLGHCDLKTTENYLASFEKEERIKNAALLTKGFND